MKKFSLIILLFSTIICKNVIAQTSSLLKINIANGNIEGVNDSGIISFKGIPFAQPPVGALRWKEPQPVQNWNGVLKADHFRSNAMQKNVFGDMKFRSDSMSEDCLYLNVWTPAKSLKDKLPVLVYFYGGGFVAGDGSESRYDGESLARKGIVTLTVNYRLGIFGFFAHPELTKESPHHASGNYGLLDQYAALKWVQQNIAAFGGDPKHVTIAGESAGSISVSAQMASPLSKNLFAAAIGESGAMIYPTLPPVPLEEGEKNGSAFASGIKASSLADLRNIPANVLLDDASKGNAFRFTPVVDGYFLTEKLPEIFEQSKQAHVPLLVGWNSAEVPYQALMQADAPTPENYYKKLKTLYGDSADEVLKLYPGATQDEVIRSATALASDRFIVYSTWKWAELQNKTGGKPVYLYVFSHPRPPMVNANEQSGLAGGVTTKTDTSSIKVPQPMVGAAHASEIEYALGNLAGNTTFAWTADDYKVSNEMEDYFANFIKTFNSNGSGLPQWHVMNSNGKTTYMHIDLKPEQETLNDVERYYFLDGQYQKK